VCPLVQLGDDEWLLELFHGPTLAFKDVALQLVGRLFDHVLGSRGEHVTIVGATSGDTGSAAIEAVHRCQHVDIVILYPAGGPSDVQRRQMTTVDAPNVRAVAVEGSFDDCQDLVKAMFNDAPFRERMRLAAVNSINWARVMAQTVYYVTTARSLAAPVTACVPTGNFGNVFAGWVARRMGSPIADFVIASNRNDILTRFVESGDLSIADVVPTLSPAMDIQVSSNFERMLWVMNDGNGARTAEQMQRFRQNGRLPIQDDVRDRWIRGAFRAVRSTDDETLAEIRRVHATTGMLIDPHTATGTRAARLVAESHPVITMATAHPAKFPDAIERATGVRPALPEHLADLLDRPERTEVASNDLAVVEDLVTHAVT
jgi:threonine synthase